MPSLLVVGLEAIAEQFLLNFHSLLNGQADAIVDGLLAVAHCNGSVLCDLAGQLQDILHQLSLRIHGVDQTNAVSLVCLDVQGRVAALEEVEKPNTATLAILRMKVKGFSLAPSAMTSG